MSERTGAIVVGAGRGRRMGGVEKAFLPLRGKPLLAYSVAVFEALAEVHEICLVVSYGSVGRAQTLARELGWSKVTAVVPGGAQRQDSVCAGLTALESCEWVLVHDAARPLLTADVVRRGLDAARETGAAVAAIPVRDTLKRTDRDGAGRDILETVDRSALWAAQTPQVFRADVLRAAFETVGTAAAATLTDDGAVVQAAGRRVVIFDGDPANLKLTLPEDLPIVEALLAYRAGTSR